MRDSCGPICERICLQNCVLCGEQPPQLGGLVKRRLNFNIMSDCIIKVTIDGSRLTTLSTD